MQLLPIRSDHNVISIASAVRNVCNATLSLIFTAFLFVWGLLVNKHQAWRTDGGTAAFGVSALSLALVSTALTFLYVPHEEEFLWLPGLIWAVVLWQSFLGWWWWVGAGSGIGEGLDSDGIRRKEKREVKRQEKRDKDGRTRAAWRGTTETRSPRRRTVSRENDTEVEEPRSLSPDDADSTVQSGSGVPTTSITATPYPNVPLPMFQRWYAKIRQAHWNAAKEQAVERVQRIRELESESRQSPWFSSRSRWGLDFFDFRSIGRADGGKPKNLMAADRRESSQERESSHKINLQLMGQNSRREGADDHGEDGEAGDDVAGVRSIWWWGPLRQWRLRDSTVY
jgi:hypothetical protein